ncbi:unnamed protein product [Aphanomyces euteiches]
MLESQSAADASEFTINFVGGPIKFRAEEGVLFSKLFHIVDIDGDGFVGGVEGAAFIRRANLPNDANREVWRLASGGKSQDRLGKDSWFVAMKLVALVQSSNKCKMQYLYEANPMNVLPLPDFHLEGPPDNINEVCNHDKLSKTFEVQIILTANNEGLVAGRELLAIAPAVAAYVPKASTVTGLWSSMKESLFVSSVQQTVEIKTDEDYTKIGEHIDEYRSRIEELVRCSDIVYNAQRAQGYEMSRCGTFLSALAVHEREDESMSHLVGNTGEVFEAVSNRYQDELDKLLALYVSNIRYLAGKVGAVKTVLTNREQAIQEVHQASATMHRNKERFAAARASSGAAASAMIAEQKMVSAEDRMNLAKEQVDFIASSLKVEAKRLYLGKTEELKQSLLALASTNNDYHAASRQAWEALIPLINVTEQDHQASLERVKRPVEFRKPGVKPDALASIL